MSAARPMSVAELTAGLPGLTVQGDDTVRVTGIAYDSRRVRPGDLFVAVPGTKDDGSRYAVQALAAGASAIVAASEIDTRAPLVRVLDVRLAMGLFAARLYDHPDRKLTLVGITGTNGKTTTSYLVEAILGAAGHRTGVIGTVNYRLGGEARPAPTTTPESVDIFEILHWMVEGGATHAVMEVSSHALDQKRVSGLVMTSAAFTNLTQDHLDYHRDFEDYYGAKKKLFTHVIRGAWTEGDKSAGFAAVNQDDQYGARLLTELGQDRAPVMSYGIKSEADVTAREIRTSLAGVSALIAAPGAEVRVDSKLVGAHNLENILAAVTLCLHLGIAPSLIERGIADLARVPGRLEPVTNGSGITVLVDYAHTPDALEHAVGACRELTEGRLITVFGCGGDRDRGKRPLMGRIAVEGSHLAMLTSDNPRTEDPAKIIADVREGIDGLGAKEIPADGADRDFDFGRTFAVEPDRHKAIRAAIMTARTGDVVLIAGKGHEDYQILGTTKIHFDDREQAAKALKDKGE